MPLDDLRKQIDALDSELLRLLNQRADLVHEIGVIKKEQGLQIYAPEREEAVFTGLVKKNAEAPGRLPEKSVRAIFREIMSAALALESTPSRWAPCWAQWWTSCASPWWCSWSS